MKIRKATVTDIPAMMEIFDYGREVQRLFGNPNHWDANYPSEELIKERYRQWLITFKKSLSHHFDGTGSFSFD